MARGDGEYVQTSDDDTDVDMGVMDEELEPSRGPKKSSRATKKGSKSKGKGKANEQNYSWEASYTRSWDTVQEDESGNLAVEEFLTRRRRRRLQAPTDAMRRTIIRHMVLILDLSQSMMDRDMRPSRFDLMLEYSREFVNEWFDQNPLGQIGIVGMREGIAEKIGGMSGTPQDVLKAIADRRKLEPSGAPSLQNALEMARAHMSYLPTHSSKEVVVIFGSLTTVDPGNVHDTLKSCINDRIQISVVALAAEMKICRDFCHDTGGTFGVAMNEGHFKDMLFELVPPPIAPGGGISNSALNGAAAAAAASSGAELMMMGFPTRLPDTSLPSLCACHSQLKSEGYLCPRCDSKVCDVPTDCGVCGLMIVSAPHLARSYHHLFPVKPFTAVKSLDAAAWKCFDCQGCSNPFPANPIALPAGSPGDEGFSRYGRYRCPVCSQDFCSECDVFIHDVLHVCPGCGM